MMMIMMTFNDDFFEDFSNISEHLPKISGDSPKAVQRPDKRFQTFSENSQRLLKISRDNQRFPRKNQ